MEDHRRAKDRSALARALGLLGDAESRLGQLDFAMAHLREAIAIDDQLEAETGKTVPIVPMASRTFIANALRRQDQRYPKRGYAEGAWAAQEESLARSIGVPAADLNSVLKRIGPDTVVIQQGSSDDEIRFWLLTKDRLDSVSAGEQDSLFALAVQFGRDHGSSARLELSRRIRRGWTRQPSGRRGWRSDSNCK